METILATFGVLMAPTVLARVPIPGGFIGSFLFSKVFVLGAIIFITTVTNIIRSMRLCDKYDTSTALITGILKGFILGIASIMGHIFIGFIPPFKATTMLLLSLVPGFSEMFDGAVLAGSYVLANLFFGSTDCA